MIRIWADRLDAESLVVNLEIDGQCRRAATICKGTVNNTTWQFHLHPVIRSELQRILVDASELDLDQLNQELAKLV